MGGKALADAVVFGSDPAVPSVVAVVQVPRLIDLT
jgi:hypothetical protein